MECDGCKNPFHESCLNFNGNSSNPDLIQLCSTCSNDNQICASKKTKGKKKSPAKSSIPTLISKTSVKSLRSRNISIDVSNVEENSTNQKSITQVDRSNVNDVSTNQKSIGQNDENEIIHLKNKINALESRLSAQENLSCKCSDNRLRITNLENAVKVYHEVIMNNHALSLNFNDSDFKMDFDIDSLRYRIEFANKIADIESTMKEERLVFEQLFVNQMDIIQKRMEIQEQTIKSCESLMELEATNDTLVEKNSMI